MERINLSTTEKMLDTFYFFMELLRKSITKVNPKMKSVLMDSTQN